MSIDDKIIKFIGRHHVLTLATTSESFTPSCCSLFYVYIASENHFIFTSSSNTNHADNMMKNKTVAANIHNGSKIVSDIMGLQIEGVAHKVSQDYSSKARNAYLKKFPYAMFMDIELWVLTPFYLKLTDNRVGFANKLIWSSLRCKKESLNE